VSPHHAPAVTRLAIFVIVAGLLAATLDIVFACTFWALQANVSVRRILQSIAAGIYGRASFSGGTTTAVIGLGLHLGITLCMALFYAVLAARCLRLRQQPLRCGALYGVLLYALMTLVVVPLSAAVPQSTLPLWVVSSLVAHVLLVGVPIAVVVSAAWRIHRFD
jgi:uncharacterized membrane protein YagU involved in acid resistance